MPRFLLSKTKVLEQYNILKQLGLKVSYSVKTNTDITEILEDNTDSEFNVHSINEAKFVKDKSRLWFLPQAWNKEDINNLLKQNITKFIVDNEYDLKTLLDYKPKKKITLLLRMKLKENTIFTGKYFVFGFDSKEINEWVKKLKKIEFIEKVGIHFHRKTHNLTEWSLKAELQDSLTEETLRSIQILNIGGGLPAEYKNINPKTMPYIYEKISELKEFLNKYNIVLYSESSRFISAPSVKLETEIKLILNNTIIVDASVYNSSMDVLLVPIKFLVENELEKGKSYVIKGITPCSMDIFRYDVKLNNPKVGDKIVFLNAGAYNFHTEFCNMDKIKTVIVE